MITAVENFPVLSTVHYLNSKFKNKLQNGKASRPFISELSVWRDYYNLGTTFKCIALIVFMMLPCLLLQKPSRDSKAKDHLKKLEEI